MTEQTSFAATFRAARRGAGLTQAQAARRLKVHLDTIKNWENGRREPPVVTPLTQRAALALLKESEE